MHARGLIMTGQSTSQSAQKLGQLEIRFYVLRARYFLFVRFLFYTAKCKSDPLSAISASSAPFGGVEWAGLGVCSFPIRGFRWVQCPARVGRMNLCLSRVISNKVRYKGQVCFTVWRCQKNWKLHIEDINYTIQYIIIYT